MNIAFRNTWPVRLFYYQKNNEEDLIVINQFLIDLYGDEADLMNSDEASHALVSLSKENVLEIYAYPFTFTYRHPYSTGVRKFETINCEIFEYANISYRYLSKMIEHQKHLTTALFSRKFTVVPHKENRSYTVLHPQQGEQISLTKARESLERVFVSIKIDGSYFLIPRRPLFEAQLHRDVPQLPTEKHLEVIYEKHNIQTA